MGRIFVFLFGAILNLALFVALLFLKTDSSEVIVVYFIVAALWGLADSVWNIQLNCNYVNYILKISLDILNHSFIRLICLFQHSMGSYFQAMKRRLLVTPDCGDH